MKTQKNQVKKSRKNRIINRPSSKRAGKRHSEEIIFNHPRKDFH
jgi:hypothetical protein